MKPLKAVEGKITIPSYNSRGSINGATDYPTILLTTTGKTDDGNGVAHVIGRDWNAANEIVAAVNERENITNELESRREDSAALQKIIETLKAALPNFKGCPAPTDWAHAAIRALIDVAKASKKTLTELKHWHGWRCTTTEDYVDSDGFKVCKARIDRMESALAGLNGLNTQPDNEDAQAILAAQKPTTFLDPDKIGGLSDIHNKGQK